MSIPLETPPGSNGVDEPSDRLHEEYYRIDRPIPVPSRYDLIARLVRTWTPTPSPRVLEIGPERPAVSETIVRRLGITPADYEAVDRSTTSAGALRAAGFTTRVLDVSNDPLPYAPGSWDVVIASEVLEHLSRPEWFLRNCRQVLRPRGILVLTTPNLGAWFNRLLLGIGRQPIYTETGSEWVFGRDPFATRARPVGHIHVLTLRALRQLLDYVDLDVLEMTGACNEEIRTRGGVASVIDRAAARFPGMAADIALAARRPEGR